MKRSKCCVRECDEKMMGNPTWCPKHFMQVFESRMRATLRREQEEPKIPYEYVAWARNSSVNPDENGGLE
jgi:hypothetical protein